MADAVQGGSWQDASSGRVDGKGDNIVIGLFNRFLEEQQEVEKTIHYQQAANKGPQA